VGALERNAERIVAFAHEARERGAELMVTPELAVTGYPPRDLLFSERFVREAARKTAWIAEHAPRDLRLLVGTLGRGARKLTNAAALIQGGEVRATRAKRLLPSYSVFFEERWFEPGPPPEPLGALGVLLCEDLWDERYDEKPARALRDQGASLLVALNASPYRRGVAQERLRRARRAGGPLVYVNAVGAEDELIFDGGSFALDASGRLLASLPRFQEALEVVDMAGPLDSARSAAPSEPRSGRTGEGIGEIGQALVLGLERFAHRNGCKEALLGLSGGVDSALVLCLACDALGAENVRALAIPSRFNDPRSEESARELARALGARFEVVSLEPLLAAAERSLDLSGRTTFENVQARLRMTILMADLNRRGGLLLNTSNKTELALGYGTLWGDLAGDLAPIGDLDKSEVYALARAREAIPRFILERPPSAELAPAQTDPFDYATVAPLADRLLAGESPDALVREGFAPALVQDCARRVRAAEHKRRLAPIVLKVHEDAIGSGRLIPVTQGSSPSRLRSLCSVIRCHAWLDGSGTARRTSASSR